MTSPTEQWEKTSFWQKELEIGFTKASWIISMIKSLLLSHEKEMKERWLAEASYFRNNLCTEGMNQEYESFLALLREDKNMS